MNIANYAMLARVNLEESVEASDLGLPDCAPGELAWLATR
jgi:hypothetical protein